MTNVVIHAIDSTDEGGVLACDAVLRVAYSSGREHVPWRSPDALLARLRDPKPGRISVFLIARLAGEDVGAAEAHVDPGEPAGVEIGVLGARRTRGVGTALAERMREELAGHATIVQSEVYLPEGVAFARGLGLGVGNEEHRLLLAREELLRRTGILHDEVGAASGDGVDVMAWTGPCPEPLIEAWASLQHEMHDDVPLGDMTRGTAPSVASLRQDERRLDAAGFLLVRALARCDGEPVGYTEMLLDRHDPRIVMQEDTLVRRAHRGRGIARHLKRVNLAQLVALPDFGQVEFVQTYTATTNGPMLALNGSLGFTVVDTMTDMEGRVHVAQPPSA